MDCQYVRSTTEDGLELQGLLKEPEGSSNTALLHMHGLAGNFYENRFIDTVAEQVTASGIGFLTANNRGHDFMSYSLKDEEGEYSYYQGGCAYETFESCVEDLECWISFLTEQGYSKVILQGHSSGALKSVYYQAERDDNRLAGLVLLSPSDDVGLQRKELDDEYGEALDLANEMIAADNGDDLMPDKYFDYPISAKTYVNMYGHDTNHDVFSFYRDKVEELRDIEVPILAIYGTVDEAVVGDVSDCLATIEEEARSAPSCSTEIIEGAPHNYLEHEGELAETVDKWLAVHY